MATTREIVSLCLCVHVCICVCVRSDLVEDKSKLVGVQRPLWWVWLAIDQARSQTGHGAVVDNRAELQTDSKGEVRPKMVANRFASSRGIGRVSARSRNRC